MKVKHGLRRNRNKSQKNYGCFLFLVGLLFVQHVYGSGSNLLLGLDEKQRKSLEGLYIRIYYEDPVYATVELNFFESNFKLGSMEYNKQCDGHSQYLGSKFCWANDKNVNLVLHDDDTLRLYQQSKILYVYYKVNPNHTDIATLKDEIQKQIYLPENRTKTQKLRENMKSDSNHFAEFKEVVSEIISPRKISPLLLKKNILADLPWNKISYYLIGVGVVIFILAGLCCIFCCNTSNEEIRPDVDDLTNQFPSTTDLVLEVKENITEKSIETETTQCSLSVEYSHTDITVTDSIIDFGTQSSALSEQSKSAVVSSLLFSEEASIVESMKSQSQSIELTTNQKRKPSQFPTKEQKKSKIKKKKNKK